MVVIWKSDQSFSINREVSSKEQVSFSRPVETIWFLVAVDTEWDNMTTATIARCFHSLRKLLTLFLSSKATLLSSYKIETKTLRNR